MQTRIPGPKRGQGEAAPQAPQKRDSAWAQATPRGVARDLDPFHDRPLAVAQRQGWDQSVWSGRDQRATDPGPAPSHQETPMMVQRMRQDHWAQQQNAARQYGQASRKASRLVQRLQGREAYAQHSAKTIGSSSTLSEIAHPNTPPAAPDRAERMDSNVAIQRTIGAELEVEVGGLEYDTDDFTLSQGEVIGQVIHETSGLTTEIHAEQPKNDTNPGAVTLEYASGKYRNKAAENTSAMAADAAELAGISKIIAGGNTQWLRPGLTPSNMNPTEANIQINVSPVSGTSTQLGSFVAGGATLTGKGRSAADNMVPDEEGYHEIYEGLAAAMESLLASHGEEGLQARQFYQAMLTPLAMHISGLLSFYFRTSTGTLTSTPKNAFQAMPRYDLTKLIDSELRKLYEDSYSSKIQQYGKGLAAWIRVIRGNIQIAFEGTMDRDPDQEIGMLDPDPQEMARIPEKTAASMTALIWGGAILVGSRPPAGQEPGIEPRPILDTTSSKIPISPDESPEGAYEIRKPFIQNVPINGWAAALNAYELQLYKAGVRYLDDH